MNAQPEKYLGHTRDLRDGDGFDAARLTKYMGDTVPGFAGPMNVQQFEGGQSNYTYLLSTPDTKYVLRRKPPGKLLKSAHAVDREYRIMKALADADVPVPQVFTLCEDESVVGTMFYVMAHVPGRVFMDSSMPDLEPQERAAVFDSVNQTLSKLARLDYVGLGLEDYGRPGNYFARQISRWVGQYEASRTEDIADMENLISWLPANVPQDDGLASITHGDFSFHNMLIHPDEPRVAAVLDWELSTIGHPLGDLMYHLSEWYRPPGVDPRGSLRDRDVAALGIPTMKEYVTRYAERTGFSVPANPDFYIAFNLFRQAAILQGIVSRARAGNASSERAVEWSRTVRPLAAAAWSHAQAAGAV